MKDTKIHWALASASLYSSFQVISNVLSTKITLLPILNLSMDGGTILYPITFSLRDFVHKSCGKKNARIVVFISAAISLLAFFFFWVVGRMNPDPAWLFQNEYNSILLPVLRISIASVVAQTVSELIDTEIFSIIYKRINDLAGSFLSNLAGLISDSIIFCAIAFWGILPAEVVFQIIASNVLVKLAISTLTVPIIRLVPRKVSFDEI